jgi:uncharacterized protein YoxC
MAGTGPILYFILLALFVLAVVLFIYLEKLLGKVKRIQKAIKRLEGSFQVTDDEPPEWL